MTDRTLILWLALAAVAVVPLMVLICVSLVWLGDLFSEDPRAEWPSRQAPYAVAPPGPAWVRELPPSRTPWDVPPLTRAEIDLSAILYVIDRAGVPCLRDPAWVRQTMRQVGAS